MKPLKGIPKIEDVKQEMSDNKADFLLKEIETTGEPFRE